MPRVRRKSKTNKNIDRVFRIYDEKTQEYYAGRGRYGWPKWTKNVSRARTYKRLSDAINSISQSDNNTFEVSEDRYKIVEYLLTENGIVDSLTLEETYYEKRERERREQNGISRGGILKGF